VPAYSRFPETKGLFLHAVGPARATRRPLRDEVCASEVGMLLEPPTETPRRYRDSVANRAWHTPSRPDVFRRGVTVTMVADPGRMRSLIDGVCIKLLTKQSK
jgi:hypothetical protein